MAVWRTTHKNNTDMIRTITKIITTVAILAIAPNPAGAFIALLVFAAIERGEIKEEAEANR